MSDTHNSEDPSAGDDATVQDFENFQVASTHFSDSATELMAASVRMQMLMLDDTRMTLSEVADLLARSIRVRKDSGQNVD